VPVFGSEWRDEDPTLVRSVAREMNYLHDAFKLLPGYERQYVPRSEYLYKVLQPLLDDPLFLGEEYESAFDRFEVLYALEHAHRYSGMATGAAWGPVGRFGWKFSRGRPGSPFHEVVAEAEAQGLLWPPLLGGLFGGSLERFREVAKQYGESLSGLHWS